MSPRRAPAAAARSRGFRLAGNALLSGQSVVLGLDGERSSLTISCSGVSFLWGPAFAYHGTVFEWIVFLVLPVVKIELGYILTFNT